MWFRNKRKRGYSRWHWDDTPKPPDFFPAREVDIKCLPLSICKSVNRELLLDEHQEEQPEISECCPLCIKELENRKAVTLPTMDSLTGYEPRWNGRRRIM